MNLTGTLMRRLIERQARSMSLDELKRWLRESGERVGGKLAKAASNRVNVEAAKHVIGIERWGQRRLRVLLGEPFLRDEYDGYRPDDLNNMRALSEAFASTRADTLALIDQLQAAGVAPDQQVFHNEYGDFTLRAWLRYFNDHAIRETLRVR